MGCAGSTPDPNDVLPLAPDSPNVFGIAKPCLVIEFQHNYGYYYRQAGQGWQQTKQNCVDQHRFAEGLNIVWRKHEELMQYFGQVLGAVLVHFSKSQSDVGVKRPNLALEFRAHYGLQWQQRGEQEDWQKPDKEELKKKLNEWMIVEQHTFAEGFNMTSKMQVELVDYFAAAMTKIAHHNVPKPQVALEWRAYYGLQCKTPEGDWLELKSLKALRDKHAVVCEQHTFAEGFNIVCKKLQEVMIFIDSASAAMKQTAVIEAACGKSAEI